MFYEFFKYFKKIKFELFFFSSKFHVMFSKRFMLFPKSKKNKKMSGGGGGGLLKKKIGVKKNSGGGGGC